MDPQTLSLRHLPDSECGDIIREAERIFFETAPDLSRFTPEERSRFQYKYFGIYLETPESFFVTKQGSRITGYLAGATETRPLHYELNPYLESFKDQIESSFPAHLHINLHSDARGQGTGSALLQAFCSYLSEHNVSGVHIVTGKDARNAGFYSKNGFLTLATRGPRILMGKSL